MNQSSRRGFTLIELLVVIAIIGVLSTLAIVALGSARQKSRDTKRLADLRQIGTALELYYSDNGSYPTMITPGNSLASGSTTYLAKIPQNPVPRNDGNCPNEDYQYSYITATNTYVVSSCLSAASGSFNTTPIGYHTGSGLLNCGGKLVDRDGYTYRTVQIGGQCWMADNLSTRTKPDGSSLTNLSDNAERDCIATTNVRGTESDCTAGRTLYRWTAIMNGSVAEGAQGICPTGWHIPSDAEWSTFETLLWDGTAACSPSRPNGTYGCTGAGTKWASGGAAGFNLSNVGLRANDNSFSNATSNAYIWSSTDAGGNASWYRGGNNSTATIMRAYIANNQPAAISLRCVK